MNFFDQQQSARRRTAALVLLFLLATAAIVAGVNVVVLGVVSYFSTPPVALLDSAWPRVSSATVVWTTLATVGVIGGASLYRLVSLADGGAAVARTLGATLVSGTPHDPLRRQLRNVVEEIAIAAGVPVPQVYVLESETGINALAAGYNAADAAIVVTRGTLEYLTRDELQGVIAHEFSHVLNGDMRLNTRLMALLFGILIVALAGRFILRGASEAGGRAAVLGLALGGALATIGYTGLLCARLIKAAVSRSREYLADAAAVQFTRHPAGIAGALKKLAVSPLRAALPSPAFEEVSHMLIADRQSWRQSWFASHPPLLDRIRRIEPRFRAEELRHIRLQPRVPDAPEPAPAPDVGRTYAVNAMSLAGAIGRPDAPALATASAQLAHIPDALRDAAHSADRAETLVLALLSARRAAGLVALPELAPEQSADVQALAPALQRLDAALHLTLLELALPALRQRPAAALRRLVRIIDRQLDGNAVRAFDYALSRLVRLNVLEALAPRRAARAPLVPPKLYRLRRDVQLLLAVMATAGHDDTAQAAAAYARAIRHVQPHDPLPYVVPGDWARALDLALLRLDRLAPVMKQTLVEALALAISHDGLVMIGEFDLLRGVCALLHCPLPPLNGATDAAAAAPAVSRA